MREVDSAADEMIEQIRLRGLKRSLDEVDAEHNKLGEMAVELHRRKNALLQEVHDTEQKLEAIRLANKKWNPKFPTGHWLISNDYRVVVATTVSDSCLLVGKYRDDRDIATRAATELRIHSRLLAYRDEFDPNFEWTMGGYNYYVTKGTEGWRLYCDRMFRTPGVVYMSKDIVLQLIDKLNKGTVEL